MSAPPYAQTELPPGCVWAISPHASGYRQVAHVYRWDDEAGRPGGLCNNCPKPFQMAFTQPGRLCLRCEAKLCLV